MKLSQVRPCDNCGGKIAPMFYVIRFSMAMFKVREVNTNLGLAQMFGGNLGVAEAMSQNAEAVMVFGEEKSELWTELFICQACFTGDPNKPRVDLAILAERVGKEKNEKGMSK